MENLRIHLDFFRSCATHPRRTIKASCEESGKRSIGWVAPYAPEELLYATGRIPVGIWGGNVELKNARIYLPAFACSIMQSILEHEVLGTYDDLDAVVIPAVCDTLKCFGQKWKGKCPSIHFVHPQNRESNGALTFYKRELELLKNKLEVSLQMKISDVAIAEAIEIYNDYRQEMRQFLELAYMHPNSISVKDRQAVLRAAYFMDKIEFTKRLKIVNEILKVMPKEETDRKALLISGITFEPIELLDMLEEYGFYIACDDLAQGSRQLLADVSFDRDPLCALAKHWIDHTPCSVIFDRKKRRVKHLSSLAKSHNVDGVILGIMKFCDPEEYDVPLISKEMKENDIPMLTIDIEQQGGSIEQIRTRLQSFHERLSSL